jgi:hypothetical protein
MPLFEMYCALCTPSYLVHALVPRGRPRECDVVATAMWSPRSLSTTIEPTINISFVIIPCVKSVRCTHASPFVLVMWLPNRH